MRRVLIIILMLTFWAGGVRAQSPAHTPTPYSGSITVDEPITRTLTCEEIRTPWRNFFFYAMNTRGWLNLFVDLSIVSMAIGHIGSVLGTLTRRVYRLRTTGDDGGWRRWRMSYRRRR